MSLGKAATAAIVQRVAVVTAVALASSFGTWLAVAQPVVYRALCGPASAMGIY
jgi:hypothetical protein